LEEQVQTLQKEKPLFVISSAYNDTMKFNEAHVPSSRLFSSQTFSHISTPPFLKPSHSSHTYLPMNMEQSVLKLRHIKFRCRGITQKKAYKDKEDKNKKSFPFQCLSKVLTGHKLNLETGQAG
jgi:hypothetical protein